MLRLVLKIGVVSFASFGVHAEPVFQFGSARQAVKHESNRRKDSLVNVGMYDDSL